MDRLPIKFQVDQIKAALKEMESLAVAGNTI